MIGPIIRGLFLLDRTPPPPPPLLLSTRPEATAREDTAARLGVRIIAVDISLKQSRYLCEHFQLIV